MNYHAREKEHFYVLKDIQNFEPHDFESEREFLDQDEVKLPYFIVRELNYARALNGSPFRLVRMDQQYYERLGA